MLDLYGTSGSAYISSKHFLMTNSNDAVDVMAGILKAVASGEITPDEANRISNTIDTYRKSLETSEFENRIIALDQRITQ